MKYKHKQAYMKCAEVIQAFVEHSFSASEYPKRLKKYFGDKE